MVVLLASTSFSAILQNLFFRRSDQIDWHLRNPQDLSQAIAVLSHLLKSFSSESVNSRLLDAAALRSLDVTRWIVGQGQFVESVLVGCSWMYEGRPGENHFQGKLSECGRAKTRAGELRPNYPVLVMNNRLNFFSRSATALEP
jgi:hypothetical protein